MARIGRRYQVPVCWANLDFEVSRHSSDGEEFLHAEVAVRGTDEVLHGSRLTIQLLDASLLPLTKINPDTLDFVELPWVSMHGMRSAFKSAEFAAAALPMHISIQLDDEHYLCPLNDEDEGGVEEDGDGDGENGGNGTGDGDHGEVGNPDRCCPDKFETPSGAQPSTVRTVGARVYVFCKPWVINATFSGTPDPCKCACCRYRQRIKGKQEATFPGDKAPTNVSMAKDYKKIAGPVKEGEPSYEPVQLLPASDFVEDATGIVDAEGKIDKPTVYGDRDDIKARPHLFTMEDYPTDCSYWALDIPQGSFIKGAKVDIDVTFEGAIIDTCNKSQVVKGPETWTWKYNGTV